MYNVYMISDCLFQFSRKDGNDILDTLNYYNIFNIDKIRMMFIFI